MVNTAVEQSFPLAQLGTFFDRSDTGVTRGAKSRRTKRQKTVLINP